MAGCDADAQQQGDDMLRQVCTVHHTQTQSLVANYPGCVPLRLGNMMLACMLCSATTALCEHLFQPKAQKLLLLNFFSNCWLLRLQEVSALLAAAKKMDSALERSRKQSQELQEVSA
jgi:hypothetical protein